MVASIALGAAGRGSFRGHEPFGNQYAEPRDPLYCCHRQFFCIAFMEPRGTATRTASTRRLRETIWSLISLRSSGFVPTGHIKTEGTARRYLGCFRTRLRSPAR
jgi:hypothetical protein